MALIEQRRPNSSSADNGLLYREGYRQGGPSLDRCGPPETSETEEESAAEYKNRNCENVSP